MFSWIPKHWQSLEAVASTLFPSLSARDTFPSKDPSTHPTLQSTCVCARVRKTQKTGRVSTALGSNKVTRSSVWRLHPTPHFWGLNHGALQNLASFWEWVGRAFTCGKESLRWPKRGDNRNKIIHQSQKLDSKNELQGVRKHKIAIAYLFWVTLDKDFVLVPPVKHLHTNF